MLSTINIKKLQAASGLFMAIFLVLHMTSHYLLNVSYEAADTAMQTFRRNVYQHFLFEITFYAAMVVHFYCNYHTYQRRRRSKVLLSSNPKKTDGDKPNSTTSTSNNNKIIINYELQGHRVAGYILSVLVIGHVAAVRVVPLLYFENPQDFDYSFAGAAIDFFPYHSFTLYYILLGMAGGWHLIFGVRAAMATMQQGKSVVHTTPFPMPLKVVASASHLLIIGAVLALGRYYTTIEWSTEQRDLHEHFFRVMGM